MASFDPEPASGKLSEEPEEMAGPKAVRLPLSYRKFSISISVIRQ